MRLSQSIIKAFYHDGNLRDYCGKQIYHKYIACDIEDIPSSSQRKGLYFEQLILGSTRDATKIILTEKEIKSVAYKRIIQQAEVCKGILLERGAIINPDTVQMEIECPYNDDITLVGHMDLLTPLLKGNGDDLGLTIVDIKLTGDVNSTFGEFCWGTPELIDSIQFYMYNHIFKCQIGKSTSFAYYVFDYKPIPEHKIIYKHLESLGQAQFQEAIKGTIEEMNKCERYGWHAIPTKGNCRYCVMKKDCEEYKAENAFTETEVES